MKRRRRNSNDSSPSASRTKGLWRDRNFLVIDLHEHEFPPRCLKSNLPCEVPAEAVPLWTQSAADREADQLDFDVGLARVAKVTYGHKSPTTVEIRLPLPLRPGWRRLITSRLGTQIAATGGAGVLLSFLLAWLGPTLPDWAYPRIWGRMILLSLAVTFFGFFVRLCLSWILPIRRIEEKMVWLGGVHRDWLKSLPEFVPSSQMLIRELEMANWKFWLTLGVGLVFMFLVFITIATLPEDHLGRWMISIYLVAIAIAILIANATSSHILLTRRRLEELYLSRIRRRKRR